MTTLKIRELKNKRSSLGHEATAIMQAAQDGNRAMTPDEETKFDALMDERDQVDRTIERMERLLEQDRQGIDDIPDDGRPGNRGGAEAARMDAWNAYLRDGRPGLTADHVRALNAGNDPEGGFLVAPEEFVNRLLANVDDQLPLRGLATVMRLTTAESLGVPTRDADLADATWTSEVGTGSQDDGLRFGKRELRPHPLAKRVKVSRTLLRRASMDPEQIVRERMAYRHATAQENAFMTGDGNQKPLGLFTVGNADLGGITTSRDRQVPTDGTRFVNDATNGYAADALIDAKYALKPQYHARARWLFHRLVLAEVRKIKDANDQYIWKAGLGDAPDTILEIPHVLSEFAPSTLADNDYIGMLGDFSFYWIVDALQFEIQRLVELYAEANQIGFIGRMESDAMPVLEEPFIRLQSNDTVA
ncbi:phage capsid protein [Streptomyces spinoverrucosus]|uniref:Phage capsid protein n=1 Tax=Streptomyces spinoverrucosus TaxID=284043 RepID=A0A4Y3VBN6_9ACTN|nr:phage major capsid protein [Streptomyces spinoverrucosus]GEC02961.1 phage capsid protein [Streptomyces spinoverrucosus]GHB39269.1 phage capsid protein [Streptomyces spinoverrucosus]